MSPREAFFTTTEVVAADQAAGRIAAEQVAPYPSGSPAVIPGERLTDAVIGYLRSGPEVGMTPPDAADPTMRSFRVVS